MRGKSRACLIAAGTLEILYGLTFVCMGVACSYLSVSGVSSDPSYSWSSSGAAGSASGSSIPVWQRDDMNAFSQPNAQPVRRDATSTMALRKDISGHGTWLAILYAATGFFAVIGGQEDDRIVPLLHTVLALVCIAWAPLMFELLYLLVRPSSMYTYSFLNEMDLISSQKHWAAYIISICVVVAGSALYLFSAALAAYQYGVRMIERPARTTNQLSTNSGNGVSAPSVTHQIAQKTAGVTKSHEPKKPEAITTTTAAEVTETRKGSPTTKTTRSLNQLQLTLPVGNNDLTSDGEAARFIKHSRTDVPLHSHTNQSDHPQNFDRVQHSASASLPRTQSRTGRIHNHPGDRTHSSSRQDLDRHDNQGRSPRENDDRDVERRDRSGGYNSARRYGDRGGRTTNNTQIVYGLGHYYDDSQEAVV